jgi:hypothetical protein
VHAAAGCNVCGVNGWSGRLLTYVIPAAAGGLGFEGSKRFASDT